MIGTEMSKLKTVGSMNTRTGAIPIL